jgi:type IV fimbrial biogenesis protein FimT
MTAELLGWTSTMYAFARAFVATAPQRSRPRSLPYHATDSNACTQLRTALQRERGFTITELMVSIGIVAILSGIGAPLMTGMIASQQVKTATFDFYSALSFARSEAIKRNAIVTILPRSGNFANGYDLRTGGDTVRSEVGSVAVAFTVPSGVALAFDGYGRLTSPGQYQVELTSARDSTVPKRCLVISPTGRPSIRVDTNHDGNCVNG